MTVAASLDSALHPLRRAHDDRRLTTIEAGRGLAALAVVFFHANVSLRFMGQPDFRILSFGENGVDFFFVLSGFIITYVHGKDIGRGDRLRPYAIKRFIRLFPILWIVVCSWIAVRFLAGDLKAEAIGTSLFLYPSLTPPLPYVVWTLRHEFLFYCAFAVLIFDQRAGVIIFSIWAASCAIQIALSASGNAVTGLASFFLSSFSLDFMAGMVVAYIHRRVKFRDSTMPMAVATIILVSFIVIRNMYHGERLGMLDYTSTGATFWTLFLGIGFAIFLHGLLCAEKVISVPKPLLMLGACSYSLYLFHTCLNSGTQHLGARLAFPFSDLFMILTAVIGGWLLYAWVERPVTNSLRHRLLSSGLQPGPSGTYVRGDITPYRAGLDGLHDEGSIAEPKRDGSTL